MTRFKFNVIPAKKGHLIVPNKDATLIAGYVVRLLRCQKEFIIPTQFNEYICVKLITQKFLDLHLVSLIV
jgi:hypothetical protein